MMQPPQPHISALILGPVELSDDVTYYDIMVSDGARKWSVLQRYNSFLQLHDSLLLAGVRLPQMPPKSTFRICFSPSFKKSRQHGLQSVLNAATAADPVLALPPLRSFLTGPAVANQSHPQAYPAFAQAVPAYAQQVPACAQTAPAVAQPGPALGQPVPAYGHPAQMIQTYSQQAPAQAAPAFAQAVPAYAQAAPAYAQPGWPQGSPCGQPGPSAYGACHEDAGGISAATAAVGAGVAGLVGGMILENALEDRRHIDTIGGFGFGHERIIEDVRQPVFFGLGGSEEVRETVQTDIFGDTEVRREVIDRDMFGNVEEVREEITDCDAFGDVTESIEIDEW
mmetsp:Transcript_31595/g.90711  ORF Transcript_31595/g.90711 Transcript_31595/m.90711 type:complete len:339 (-) Transcript_31595:290-1306(-)